LSVQFKEDTMLNRSLPVFALALAAFLPLAAPAAMAESEAPTITVTGEGMSEVTPDLATLSIGVTTTGATAAEALAANSASLAAVLEKLKAAGIEDRDIQTSNLSVNPNWTGYDSSISGPKIADYTAMNFVTIKIRKLDGLGAVLDAAVSDGANTVNGLTFGMRDPRPAMDAAREAAVADAAAKAALLAKAAGLELGPIQLISEGGGMGGPAPMFKDVEASAAPVPVEAGALSMAASVTVVWELVAQE
jgi:uncharacterized protein